MINNWNIQVATWLRNYIYLRVENGDRKNRGKATATVFFTSAFWHGLLPSNYVLFFFIHLVLGTSRRIFKHKDLFNFIPGKIRTFIAQFLTNFTIVHLGSIFLLRTWTKISKFQRNVNYVVVVPLVVVYLIVKVADEYLAKNEKKEKKE
mmetsp:Transcript_597/g.676  ORF Transcript_597/g.676 Transcript_597/m.676 type:complete len:149 (+) Transcript_597:940-1386(+)